MSTPKHEAKKTPTLAAYQGAISRWCDLTGHTPDATKTDKLAAEFTAFESSLNDLATAKTQLPDADSLTF